MLGIGLAFAAMGSELAESTDDSARARQRGLLLWTLVVALLGAFLVAMAWLEPITGDCWTHVLNAHRRGMSPEVVFRQLVNQHNVSNPRFGQLFTIYACGSDTFHRIATPLVLLAFFVLVFVHAVGRAPKLTSARDAALFTFGVACCWLSCPLVGQTFFYRPVSTNYIYSLALSLLFFVPHRTGMRVRSAPAAVAAALGALTLGLVVGKCNENTGPAVILVAMLSAVHAVRRKELHDAAWKAAGALGTLVGFLFLFFAPGQSRRYDSIGKQSVLDTVLDRGVLDTLLLLAEFAEYVAPLLVLCGLLVLVLGLRAGWLQLSTGIPRARLIAASYVAVAVVVVGTSLASPIHHYRLFIAPAMLTSIAVLALFSQLCAMAATRTLLGVAALVHAGLAYIVLPLYSGLHRDHEARLRTLQAAPDDSVVRVPAFRESKASALFYGDTGPTRQRSRDAMAKVYGVRKVVLAAEPEAKKRTKSRWERTKKVKKFDADDGLPEPELP